MRFKSGLICAAIAGTAVTPSVIAGCGGGSGGGSGVASRASNSLPPAGSRLYKGSINAGSSTVLLADPGKNATLTVPAGSMTNGSTVGLTVWNAQRAAAQRSGFSCSSKAVDVTIDPAVLQPGAAITVGLPWQAGADPHTTMVVAFGASGNSTVVAETAASTASSPVASITQAQVQYLTGASSGPQTIEFAVEQQTPVASKAAFKPSHVKLYDRTTGLPASTRTAYASRTRIAIVVPGIYEDDENQSFGFVTTEQDMQPILTLLTTKLPTDGDITASSKPFDPDEVWCFNYDFTQTIETNGAALAAAINLVVDNNGKSWSDPTSFEIHFLAHSMGGLVTRWALEKVGVPAAVQLITLGTPHWGVPSAVLKQLAWIASIPLWRTTGTQELMDASSFIATMKASKRAAGVLYNFVAGSSHSGLTFPLAGVAVDVGDPINALYAVVKPVAYNANDGVVPEYSALEGAVPPGAPQPYNGNCQ